jgi:hypothetical protein
MGRPPHAHPHAHPHAPRRDPPPTAGRGCRIELEWLLIINNNKPPRSLLILPAAQLDRMSTK